MPATMRWSARSTRLPGGRLSKKQLVEWLRDLGFVVDDAGVATYRLNRN